MQSALRRGLRANDLVAACATPDPIASELLISFGEAESRPRSDRVNEPEFIRVLLRKFATKVALAAVRCKFHGDEFRAT